MKRWRWYGLAGMLLAVMLSQATAQPQDKLSSQVLIEQTEAGHDQARRQLSRQRLQQAILLLERYQAQNETAVWKDALLHAASAVDLNPDSAANWRTLGAIYLANPDRLSLQNAESALLRARQLAPNDKMSLLLLGETYIQGRRFYSARQVLLPLLQEAPPALAAQLVKQLLQAYTLNGDPKDGLAEVAVYRKQSPQNTTLGLLYTALLHMEYTVHPDSQLMARRREMARWWDAHPEAPASLKQFVQAHYLQEATR